MRCNTDPILLEKCSFFFSILLVSSEIIINALEIFVIKNNTHRLNLRGKFSDRKGGDKKIAPTPFQCKILLVFEYLTF